MGAKLDRPLTREDALRMANRTGKTAVVIPPPDGSPPRTSDVRHGIAMGVGDEDEAERPEEE